MRWEILQFPHYTMMPSALIVQDSLLFGIVTIGEKSTRMAL